jgi:acetyltransferase-like isoleucine patch superfamily enzyme
MTSEKEKMLAGVIAAGNPARVIRRIESTE